MSEKTIRNWVYNSNINYKTGVTLLESSNSKLKSLKYLKIAIKKY